MVGNASRSSVDRIGPLSIAVRATPPRCSTAVRLVSATSAALSPGTAPGSTVVNGAVARSSFIVGSWSRQALKGESDPCRPGLPGSSEYDIMVIMHYYDRNAMGDRRLRRGLQREAEDALRKGTQGRHPPPHHRCRRRAVSRTWRRRGWPRRHHERRGPDQRRFL